MGHWQVPLIGIDGHGLRWIIQVKGIPSSIRFLSLTICFLGKVSLLLDHMTEFLQKIMTRSQTSHCRKLMSQWQLECEENIGFRNATFSWSVESWKTFSSIIPASYQWQTHNFSNVIVTTLSLHLHMWVFVFYTCLQIITTYSRSMKLSMLMNLLGGFGQCLVNHINSQSSLVLGYWGSQCQMSIFWGQSIHVRVFL